MGICRSYLKLYLEIYFDLNIYYFAYSPRVKRGKEENFLFSKNWIETLYQILFYCSEDER